MDIVDKTLVGLAILLLILSLIARKAKKRLLQNVYDNTGKNLEWGKFKTAVASFGIIIPWVAWMIVLYNYSWFDTLLLAKVYGVPLFVYILAGLAILVPFSIEPIRNTEVSSGIVLTLVQALGGVLTLLGAIGFVALLFIGGAGGSSSNVRYGTTTDWDSTPAQQSDLRARQSGFRDADDAYQHGYDTYAAGDSRSYTHSNSKYTTKL